MRDIFHYFATFYRLGKTFTDELSLISNASYVFADFCYCSTLEAGHLWFLKIRYAAYIYLYSNIIMFLYCFILAASHLLMYFKLVESFINVLF